MISAVVSADLISADRWQLTEPVIYIDPENGNRRIIARAGFYTDFLSIPAVMRPFFSRTGKSAAAGVIHDALYSTQAYLTDSMRDTYPHGLNRKQADRLLKATALELGESKARANTLYWGVRIGGWYVWNKYRKESK